MTSEKKSLREWPFITMDGDESIVDEHALAILLQNEVLFSNGRRYAELRFEGDKCHLDGKLQPETTVLFVNCNDVFAWGCSDAEPLPHDEIENLFRMWYADRRWGSDKWCCKQRDQKPQKPVEDQMRKDGSWDEMMEALPPNDKYATASRAALAASQQCLHNRQQRGRTWTGHAGKWAKNQ